MLKAFRFTREKTPCIAIVVLDEDRYRALVAPAASLAKIARAKRLPRRRRAHFRLAGRRDAGGSADAVAITVISAIVQTQRRARSGRLPRVRPDRARKTLLRKDVRPAHYWTDDDACTLGGTLSSSRGDDLQQWTLDILNEDCKEWLRQQGCDMSSYAANFGVDGQGYVIWEVCECGSPASPVDPDPPVDDIPTFVPIDISDELDDIADIEESEIDTLIEMLREDEEEDEEDEEEGGGEDEPPADGDGDGDGGEQDPGDGGGD